MRPESHCSKTELSLGNCIFSPWFQGILWHETASRNSGIPESKLEAAFCCSGTLFLFFFFFKTNLYSGIQTKDQDQSRHMLNYSVGNPPTTFPTPRPPVLRDYTPTYVQAQTLTKTNRYLTCSKRGDQPRGHFYSVEVGGRQLLGVCSSQYAVRARPHSRKEEGKVGRGRNESARQAPNLDRRVWVRGRKNRPMG